MMTAVIVKTVDNLQKFLNVKNLENLTIWFRHYIIYYRQYQVFTHMAHCSSYGHNCLIIFENDMGNCDIIFETTYRFIKFI